MNGLPIADSLPAAMPTGSSDRLEALFERHYDRLYRLARRLANSADDARDLVQDTFLKAARRPLSVPCGESAEEAWLVRTLVNTRRDQWRRAAVRTREVARTVPDHADIEAALIAQADVWRALDHLTPRRRTIVVLHELEGVAVPAIASLLGLAAVTVRWHLARGRRELACTLTPHMEQPL